MTTQTESPIKHHPDDWSLTSNYHYHIERTVHPIIVELIKWATQNLPPTPSSMALDDGCGLATVTAEVKKSFPDLDIVVVDSSAAMLDVVNRKAKEHGWKNVVTKIMDSGDLTGIPSGSITHAFACTYIDLANNATACIQELHRVIAEDGILAINTWTDPTHPSISIPWTKACQKLHPGFESPLATSLRWSTPLMIRYNLEKAGFRYVQTKQVMAHWRWGSLDETTEWFFNGGNPVCKRWHEALVEETGGNLGVMRERFREELEKEYRNEGGQWVKEELVNLTIARK